MCFALPPDTCKKVVTLAVLVLLANAQDPATGEPMDHFRNTPVEKKQAVRTYERFSQVVSHLLQPNGRVLVVSEWGGRSVKVNRCYASP